MSTILGANSVQVCNAPLNNSVSKQMYSFPKAKRFDENVNKSLYEIKLHKKIESFKIFISNF